MAGVAVTWSSSDPGAARVDGSGLVTAVGNGNSTITATAGAVAGTSVAVVEQEAVTLELTPGSMEFRALGDTLRLVAKVADANGHAVETEVAWSSSDSSVVTVDATGLVMAAGNGEATVTAMAGSAARRLRWLLSRRRSHCI